MVRVLKTVFKTFLKPARARETWRCARPRVRWHPRASRLTPPTSGAKPCPQAARSYLRGMLEKAGIERFRTLRHTSTNPCPTPGRNWWTSRRCWATSHRYHPDLHQRGTRADGEGGGAVVSGPVELKTRRAGTGRCRRGRVPPTLYRDVPNDQAVGRPGLVNIDI